MATDLIQNLPGKTQTILVAETKSERWLSWIRLWCAAVVSVIYIPAWLLGKLSSLSATLLSLAVIIIAGYSTFYLFLTKNKRRVAKQYVFLLTFCDVAVITAILFSTLSPSPAADQLPGIIFCAYFIAIAFTAFHYRSSLSIFGGVASVAGYTAFAVTEFSMHPESYPPLFDFCMRTGLLLFASWLSSMVSRNNYQTVRKALSSEMRYDTLADRLPEMVFTMDSEGNFVWSNKGCKELMGLPPDKIVGMNIRSFINKPESFKLEKSGVKNQLEIRDKNGKIKFVDCTVQKTSRSSGSETYDGLMADVTDRELAVAQREEMANRLYQHQKMESIGSLASGMAHDFNNTLQTITDISAIAMKETAEPETKKRMELINETAADARFLISELLALGRKKLLDYRHIELKSFFSPIITQCQKQFGDAYRLQLVLPEESLKIHGDPDHLKRVFQNLFNNARDAMPDGGTITVNCSAKSRAGSDTAVIRVKDTGTGISPDLTEKIFDPFFTTKKPGKGTGLGLALVHRIVSLHHGRVFVEQTSPNGTTFRIEMPLVVKGESEADTKSLMLNRVSTMIIMLEDDPKIRNIMKFFLKEFDYSIIEASIGSEAIEALKANREKCRIIITDWRLGSEDPQELIKKLREIRNDLIVIVVSGYPPIAKSIETLNIYHWFTKPYDKNALDITLQRALHGIKPRT
ncbi:MAG: response regulator [Chitinispirillaceae bacterium]|nr:response regulator [Chitinispirillaceae bacterium]